MLHTTLEEPFSGGRNTLQKHRHLEYLHQIAEIWERMPLSERGVAEMSTSGKEKWDKEHSKKNIKTKPKSLDSDFSV